MEEIKKEGKVDDELHEIEVNRVDFGASMLRYLLIIGGLGAAALLIIAGFKLTGLDGISSEMDGYYDS